MLGSAVLGPHQSAESPKRCTIHWPRLRILSMLSTISDTYLHIDTGQTWGLSTTTSAKTQGKKGYSMTVQQTDSKRHISTVH